MGLIISIHAPRRERHLTASDVRELVVEFQSTLPGGSDTQSGGVTVPANAISIHAPRRERHPRRRPLSHEGSISIHAPRRERHSCSVDCESPIAVFQSTLPGGSDTRPRPPPAPIRRISIHAPRRERHPARLIASPPLRYFNPRSPEGATLLLG